MRIYTIVVTLAGLVACGGSEAPTAESCKDICAEATPDAPDAAEAPDGPAAAGASLTDFESGLLSPVIEDLRGGVRPFTEQSVGICKGERKCDEWVGTDVGELGPGKYIVMAELRVPNVGEPGTWKVNFDVDCTTTKVTTNGESSSTQNSSRSYDVRYAGKERGYRLVPLRTIESPSIGGKRDCKWKITAPHPDGDKVYSGAWITPDAG